MSQQKKETDTQFNDDLDSIVGKRRWIPVGGWWVAVPLVVFIGILLSAPFMPQVTMQLNPNDIDPLRYGGDHPKLETYDAPEDDQRVIAWVGSNTNDAFSVLSKFLFNVGVNSRQDYFGTCTALTSKMWADNYKAHLYIVSDVTYANIITDENGIFNTDGIKANITGAGCGMLIKEAHPHAKVLCLGDGDADGYSNVKECIDLGHFAMTYKEALDQDPMEREFTSMTVFEGTIRDLVELPLVPPDYPFGE